MFCKHENRFESDKGENRLRVLKLCLLDGFPGFSFKTSVNRLGDGGLHQVNISHDQRSVQVLQVLVELSIAQIIWERKQMIFNHTSGYKARHSFMLSHDPLSGPAAECPPGSVRLWVRSPAGSEQMP